METKLEREVRFLKIYALVATLACVVFLATAFSFQENKQKFGEIDVERINIVEKDGKLRMVISNEARQHPGIVNGKVIERKTPRQPGMIFFNQLGDEMGGLLFGENGGNGHFGTLTWDKVRNDQTMGFRYLEGDDGTYSSGLEMWQQPNIPGDVMLEKIRAARKITDETQRKAALKALADKNEMTTYRLFLGKNRDDSTILAMSDIKGKPRIVMEVTSDGVPKLEFLDAQGKVIYSLPEETKPKKHSKK